MRRLVMVAALLVALLAACGRGQDPALGDSKASGPPKADLTVVAKDTAFTPATLTAPAGKELTITFRNEDGAKEHSFHLFAGTAGDVKTDIKPGPSTDKLRVTLNVPASYAFQCDRHPAVMTGTIVVVNDKT